jgi:DNA invertase Pin-like site-specific DNA recombinase
MSSLPRNGVLVGYARSSTAEQEAGPQAQVRELQAIGCSKIFQDQLHC